MRAQCSICSDLYDGESNIAAIVECGHTFHDKCLTSWFAQSMTCPQCRERVKKKGVIHKLYFDEADEADDAASPSKLQNEVSTLKASLRDKDREKSAIEEEKELLKADIKKLQQEKSKIDKALKSEKAASGSLQRELSGFYSQQQQATEAIQETQRLQQKLELLTTVQTVVQGLECDVQDMISTQGDPKQLATWCTVLKSELATKRTECKKLKEQLDRLKKENAMRKREQIEKDHNLANVKEKLKHSEEDLKRSEKEIDSLKKKIGMLQSAIESPTNSKSSFVHRLIHESPAPQPLKKKPRLSSAFSDDGSEVDLNMTPDLFTDPDTPSPRKPAVQIKKDCQEFGTQYVKITKAAQNRQPGREISNPLPYNMNIFKKSAPGSSSGFMKKGYNGMGGHEKFINPFVRPSTNIVPQKPGKLSAKMRNLGPAPALPTLSAFDS